jgi:gluconate 2-dehydrogenase gamma chain
MAGRIVPADASGPGAREAGSAYFIDRRLAQPGGGAEGWYMDGPFVTAPAILGWQAEITPAQLYRGAIAQMEAVAQTRHKAPFAGLTEADQDALITGLQKGELDDQIDHAGLFFDTILNDAVAGLMADPVYGGNREFIGWKMIGHPGMRYDWRAWVSRDDPPPAGQMMGIYGPAERYAPLWGDRK